MTEENSKDVLNIGGFKILELNPNFWKEKENKIPVYVYINVKNEYDKI